MSKPTHTPGPWTAEAVLETFENDCTGELQSYLIWGVAIPPKAPATFGHTVCPLNEADAHLIAAAPELLETLKQVLAHHGYIEGGPDFPSAWAAIRKAEGWK